MFALVENAFAVLTDPVRRAEYDLNLGVVSNSDDEAKSAVKVLDAGFKLLISGEDAEAVKNTLNEYVASGSKIITSLALVGRTWVAACTIPVKKPSADQTSTLSLTDLRTPSEPSLYEDGSECTVTELGFTLLITGPTQVAVRAKVAELTHLGARLIGEIVAEDDGQWIARCDTGGQGNTGFRW